MVSRTLPIVRELESGQQTEPLLRLEDVDYTYPDGTPALRGIDLQVCEGEKLVILGANGCGKSTLLRILDALAFPSRGHFEAFGRAVSERNMRSPDDAAWFRRGIGLVFQNADAQLFSSTVREELAFAPLQLGLPREEVEQRISDAARLVEVTHVMERVPYQLSAGEKRKVAVASVLTANPQVLLLDEPTAGLDPRSRGNVAELLVRLHAAGKTLVTATHDLDLVPDLADRVIVMNEQHGIEAVGAPREIMRNGGLLASVNLIHEHMHRHGDLWHSHAHHHGGDHDHSHD